jgi:hypothetical protein
MLLAALRKDLFSTSGGRWHAAPHLGHLMRASKYMRPLPKPSTEPSGRYTAPKMILPGGYAAGTLPSSYPLPPKRGEAEMETIEQHIQ